ncbi:gluconate kinase, FGGY family [Micromonospora pallida]|uniref:Gluconate kinase, FGGY family n=1 Tax=Micromonospora pallida TaxID=145854 RepID=A0A1C6SK20_9ACTN|nr:gluconokinase [Micromonospora pallida]SCL29599.1 gluconate kinase, FGGY family [Micromonospora pallida]
MNGRSDSSTGVVLGVDIGTTSTKAVAFDRAGHVRGSSSVAYPLLEPERGHAVQDPVAIVEAVVSAVATVAGRQAAQGRPVAAVSFSSTMHTLIGVDEAGAPLTPSVTWADTRAHQQADRLRTDPATASLHARTGTPIHAMSPLAKLVWFREQQAEVFSRVRRWVGIKEYVLHALCGRWVVDHSVASATGLLNLVERGWDRQALAVTGVTAAQLSELVPVTYSDLRALPAVSARLGLPDGTPFVVGGADGPLANLGVGAVRPGVLACSIGTSGALRVMTDRPTVDRRGRLFCYALDEERWTVGGAISNGGLVLQWADQTLMRQASAAPGRVDTASDAIALAASVGPGSDGLIMLPYLMSERAPFWDSAATGAYIGLTRAHGRAHLVRAGLEGVCQQLALVRQSLHDVGITIEEIRATGGATRSPIWRQMLADVLGVPIGFPVDHEGSAYGAALVGMRAIGLIDRFEELVDRIEVGQVVEPMQEAADLYAALRPIHEAAYAALGPCMRQLRDLSG